MYLCGITFPVYKGEISEKKLLVRGVLIVGGSVYLVRRLLARIRSNKNKQKVVNKRRDIQARKKELENSLLVDGTLLTGDRAEIVSLHVDVLLEQLCSGHLSPLEVLEAYQAKALTVDKDVNAVCDFILEARDWVESLAKIPKDKRGPLYGLPISIKECFQVKGYDYTAGLAKFIGQPAEDDCEFVRCLKELHAVPFCLTNIPQTMVSYSCSNPVYGNTSNPHLSDRTPGGSSGGEGALIGAGGSILGLGSDIGGSLRIPAHFSGVCGLKPTNGRLFETGRRGGLGPGSKLARCGLDTVNGFMSSSVTGLEVAMRAVLQQAEKVAEVDWRVVPLVWREVARPDRKLRIGYYTDDGVFPPTPGITRAVDEVVELLSQAGHEMVQWTPPGLGQLMETFTHLILADKGHHALRTMEDEVIDQSIEVNMMNFRCPRLLKALVACVMDWVSPKTASLLRATLHTRDLWVDNGLKNSLIYQMMAEWQQKEFDVVLCPAFAMPAPPPQYCSRLLYATSYTCVYNLVGCPAGIVPVTKENAEDQAKLAQYPVAGDLCHRLVKQATQGAEGCPIGVQVLGRHFQDELVLHAMHIVEDLVRGRHS